MADTLFTMPDLFEACVRKNPSIIAVTHGNYQLTYGQLNQKANQVAHYLKYLGVAKGSIVAISMPRSPDLLIGVLGILKAGCAYLPLDETHPIESLFAILEDTKAKALITLSHLLERFTLYQGKIISMDSVWEDISIYPLHNPTQCMEPDHLAYVIYTSGSTGKPKGVLIEHQSLVNYIQWFGEYSACLSPCRVDFSSNIIFDMAVTTSVAALALHLQVVVCSDEIKTNIGEFLEHLCVNKINLIKLTPSYFKLMLQETLKSCRALNDLQTIVLGGEILLAADCKRWLELYPEHRLFNEYGPTEATVAVTQYQVTSKNIHLYDSIMPIGKPGRNMECVLLDEYKNPVTLGEIGELYIGGIGVAKGYLNQVELTADRFCSVYGSEKNWYKTGDFCRVLSDGNIEFIQRIDEQVKIRGFRIEPGEIQAHISSHSLIQNVVVLVHDDKDIEKKLVAYYILKDKDIAFENEELRRYLRTRLADYMIPANFIRVERFPLTNNGKLDKKALKNSYDMLNVLPRECQSEIEKTIAIIWGALFHCDVQSNANFFELGGHSLIAARMILKTEQILNKKIKLEDLYQHPTIEKFALVVESAEDVASTDMSYHSVRFSRAIPLSDFQFLLWICGFFEPKAKKLNITARRRINGALNLPALQAAFMKLLKTHEVFSYHIFLWLPLQQFKKNKMLTIDVKDLKGHSPMDQELLLTASLDELINYFPWKKNEPLLMARLFYLNEGQTELQISAPHLVFDDASEEILFSDLSKAYLNYFHNLTTLREPGSLQYKHYVYYERHTLNQQIEKDINFWESYLSDAGLLVLPAKEIIHNTRQRNFSYSTYLALPNDILQDTKQLCTHYQVTFTDIFCASIGLTLRTLVGHLNHKKLCLNIIRSLRDNDSFDRVIGCFIRLDPLKVDIHTTSDLIELSKIIQQARIVTETHQACSSMAKFACLAQKNSHALIKKNLIQFVINCCSFLSKKLFLNPKMLAMYGRLLSLQKEKLFMININMLNGLMNYNPAEKLFGSDVVQSKTHQYNLIPTDYILDICLLKNASEDKTYLVISGNLEDSFRSKIGYEIIRTLNTKASEINQEQRVISVVE